MNYQAISIRYALTATSTSAKLTPIRTAKQWVTFGNERKFITVRSSIASFIPVHGPEGYAAIKAAPLDRAGLMQQGLLRPADYESQPCLLLDDPSGWLKNPAPPWLDDEEYGEIF